MPIMITLNKIRAASLDEDEWNEVDEEEWNKVSDAHEHLELDTPFPLSDVLDSNGLEYTLWCFRALPEHIEIPKRFALWCARYVQHLMTDERSINALDVAERYLDGNATREELDAAAIAAIAANAARAAVVAVVARTAARTAVYAAIAADYAVYDADDADDAAEAAALQKQIDKLRKMLD